MRHIERVLRPGNRRGGHGPAVFRRESSRLDGPQAAVPPWHIGACSQSSRKQSPPAAASGFSPSFFTLAALSLGTMAFVCGAILLGWSLWTGRQELWNIGTPVVLCGQIALLIGLILQLERLWSHSRHAAKKLEAVDEQLHDLKSVTTLLGTSHASPAAFYAHMADGASPQLLLSDLKSQLDLLALKLSRDA